MNDQPAWKRLTDSSSPQQFGMLIISTDYAPNGARTGIRVERADRWIEVAPDFLRRLRADASVLPLTSPEGFAVGEVGKPGAAGVRYRKVRAIDERRDLYVRVDDEELASAAATRLLNSDDLMAHVERQMLGAAQPLATEDIASADGGPLLPDAVVEPVHGVLCSQDGQGRCRSPHCRKCGTVADAQGFCPRCPREEGPHADGFTLVRRVKGYRNPLRTDLAEAERLAGEQDEALREITEFASRSAARVDELTEGLAKADDRNRQLKAVLDEVLGSFTQQGYPGEPCLRTGWIGTRIVARWRRIAAGKPSYDELIERLAGVELTDEQRAMLREVWEFREVHGRWPDRIHTGGRRNGVATEREALRQLVRLAEQAGA